MIYYGEKIIRTFYEKELQKTNQKEFRIEKKLRRKVINYMSNGKDMIIHLIFLNHMNHLEETLIVKVDLSNYATKADLKNATGIDTSN